MITHEEIMRRIEENIPCSRDMFVAYIKQQQKKDELLELYRELHNDYRYPTWEHNYYVQSIIKQLKALEEELK